MSAAGDGPAGEEEEEGKREKKTTRRPSGITTALGLRLSSHGIGCVMELSSLCTCTVLYGGPKEEAVWQRPSGVSRYDTRAVSKQARKQASKRNGGLLLFFLGFRPECRVRTWRDGMDGWIGIRVVGKCLYFYFWIWMVTCNEKY